MGLRLFDNPLHLVVLLVIIVIVFGAGKLPGVGAALGQSIKEFKKSANEPDEKPQTSSSGSENCQNCQAAVPAGAQFCPSCGTAARPQVAAATAAPSTEATLFCSQCGAKNPADARFCAQCGTNMSVHAT